MNIGERSKRFVAYHIDNTFNDIFDSRIMALGLWHEVAGQIRYEALLEQTKQERKNEEAPISVLFPPFDPDDDSFDNYPMHKNLVD